MEPIDVNIYTIKLDRGKDPKIEIIQGQIIWDGMNGCHYLICHARDNYFDILDADFPPYDIDDVALPYPDTIQVVARRDTPDKLVFERIARFCRQKLNRIHNELDVFESALGLVANELTQIYKEED